MPELINKENNSDCVITHNISQEKNFQNNENAEVLSGDVMSLNTINIEKNKETCSQKIKLYSISNAALA